MSYKDFAKIAIQNNPERYGVDHGCFILANDYLKDRGQPQITKEQYKAVTSLQRRRNDFLAAHEEYDHRKKERGYEFNGQTSIYDFLNKDDAMQLKKTSHYFEKDETRINYSNSRIKKSVRGVDDNHIVTAKTLYPVLKEDPELKQRRHRKAPKDSFSSSLLETK